MRHLRAKAISGGHGTCVCVYGGQSVRRPGRGECKGLVI